MNYTKNACEKQVQMPADLEAPSWLVERGEIEETQEEKERVLMENPGVNGLMISQKLEQAQAQVQAALAELAQVKANYQLLLKAIVESQCANYDLRCQLAVLRAQQTPKAQAIAGGFTGV